MVAYFLSAALASLRSEIDARWPQRSKVSDGWIGDTSHQSRGAASDHNPRPDGEVTAFDFTAAGIDVPWLREHLRAQALAGDSRLKYLISNRRIFNPSVSREWRPYTGVNPHDHHMHVSVHPGAGATPAWGVQAPAIPAPRTSPEASAPPFPLPASSFFGPREGGPESVSGYFSHREDLRRWQRRMEDRGWSISTDGLYGDETAAVVRRFQAEKGLTVDGKIGPATWRAAWTARVTA